MKGFFVTSTDTNVAKTVVSAALMHRLRAGRRLRYWKPIQTGSPPDDDTGVVRDLGDCSEDEIFDFGIRLREPVSPHLAARWAGISISLEETLRWLPGDDGGSTWVVEGAGGVLVPLNDSELIMDLIAAAGLPVVVVARAGLGTINHTLLTLHALRARAIDVAGVVLSGEGIEDNAATIATWGKTTILGRMPQICNLNAAALRNWAWKELDSQDVLEGWLGGKA